jgi:predicted nucleic-acid-binding Zn-ribbon protein
MKLETDPRIFEIRRFVFLTTEVGKMSAKPNSIDITAGGVLPNYFFVDCKNCAFSAGNFQSETDADREKRKIYGKCPECGSSVAVEKREAEIHYLPNRPNLKVTF